MFNVLDQRLISQIFSLIVLLVSCSCSGSANNDSTLAQCCTHLCRIICLQLSVLRRKGWREAGARCMYDACLVMWLIVFSLSGVGFPTRLQSSALPPPSGTSQQFSVQPWCKTHEEEMLGKQIRSHRLDGSTREAALVRFGPEAHLEPSSTSSFSSMWMTPFY